MRVKVMIVLNNLCGKAFCTYKDEAGIFCEILFKI